MKLNSKWSFLFEIILCYYDFSWKYFQMHINGNFLFSSKMSYVWSIARISNFAQEIHTITEGKETWSQGKSRKTLKANASGGSRFKSSKIWPKVSQHRVGAIQASHPSARCKFGPSAAIVRLRQWTWYVCMYVQ